MTSRFKPGDKLRCVNKWMAISEGTVVRLGKHEEHNFGPRILYEGGLKTGHCLPVEGHYDEHFESVKPSTVEPGQVWRHEGAWRKGEELTVEKLVVSYRKVVRSFGVIFAGIGIRSGCHANACTMLRRDSYWVYVRDPVTTPQSVVEAVAPSTGCRGAGCPTCGGMGVVHGALGVGIMWPCRGE